MADQPIPTEEQPSLSGGMEQVPAAVPVIPVSAAAAEARDALLRAVAQEAELVADKSAGHASAALAELARAYALVTARSTFGTRVEARVYDREVLPVDDFSGEGVVDVDKFVNL
ncbi:hypothetical protein [Streptomyces sp. NPDC001903]|uniref:hypothetical protein n=1 Tax=Streptomyces sp. NPDC001903 TaxID=3364622 RepID=UPI00369BCDD9